MLRIKRYANRKLYDTDGGKYITLEEIAALVRGGEDVVVMDHVTGRDITSPVLLQAILGEEKRLGELLPEVVLTHLLRTGEERLGSLRARLLAAFDPERHIEEELRRRIGRLVEAGEIGTAEAGRLLENLLRGREPATVPPQEAKLDLGVLREQVEALEQQLEEIKQKGSG